MLILGLDTSAQAASVALCTEERILAVGSVNVKLTHSQTLLPLCKALLDSARLTLTDVDAFAVSAGPGSFTGLRIGISAVKGFAHALNKPCVPVSTLEALAENLRGLYGVVCAVMDARCKQVYNALFRADADGLHRLCADRAVTLEALSGELALYAAAGERILLVGDGAELTATAIPGTELAPLPLRLQSATSVCAVAFRGQAVDAASLMPSYLRIPQAERERDARLRAEASAPDGG